MKANVTAATLLLCGSIFTSPTRTCFWHRSLGSTQKQRSMAETEESAMEDENNVHIAQHYLVIPLNPEGGK